MILTYVLYYSFQDSATETIKLAGIHAMLNCTASLEFRSWANDVAMIDSAQHPRMHMDVSFKYNLTRTRAP